MEINKNLRTTIKPSNDLYRRDVRTSIKAAQTGVFTRNCVLSGKRAGDMDYPIYIRTPGILSNYSSVCPDGIGYFESSEGNANNVFPMHKDLTNNNTYWEATTLGANITYCHPLRPTTIRTYRFITINGYTPRTWKIQGSNDNTNWTTLHEVTVSWTWDDGKNKVQFDIPLENRAEYKYHRLQIDEFDTTSVRIYSLQFYDSLCSTNSSFYLDASAENPLQLAFADGYNVDGTPKDIIMSITEPIVDMNNFLEYYDLTTTEAKSSFLFIEYENENLILKAEPMYHDFINYDILNNHMVISNSGISNYENIFDEDRTNYARTPEDSSGTLNIQFTEPIYTNRCRFKCRRSSGSTRYYSIRISEDFGETWTTLDESYDFYETIKDFELDRVYYMTNLYLSGYCRYDYGSGNYLMWYYVDFHNSTKASNRKIENGKIYEYNDINETWTQVYKIPLGYFSLIRNPENTNWEIANFIPTNIPQMTFAPYFRKTSY